MQCAHQGHDELSDGIRGREVAKDANGRVCHTCSISSEIRETQKRFPEVGLEAGDKPRMVSDAIVHRTQA